jgi:hypothetical protein
MNNMTDLKELTPHEELWFTDVKDALNKAKLISWDGCHKIYVAMDDHEAQWFFENYAYSLMATPEEMYTTIRDWWNKSCGLRFISSVRYDADNPNNGFTTLVPQFVDAVRDDEDEEEDEG